MDLPAELGGRQAGYLAVPGCSCRQSGRWSQYLAVRICAGRPGAAGQRSRRLSGRGAMTGRASTSPRRTYLRRMSRPRIKRAGSQSSCSPTSSPMQRHACFARPPAPACPLRLPGGHSCSGAGPGTSPDTGRCSGSRGLRSRGGDASVERRGTSAATGSGAFGFVVEALQKQQQQLGGGELPTLRAEELADQKIQLLPQAARSPFRNLSLPASSPASRASVIDRHED